MSQKAWKPSKDVVDVFDIGLSRLLSNDLTEFIPSLSLPTPGQYVRMAGLPKSRPLFAVDSVNGKIDLVQLGRDQTFQKVLGNAPLDSSVVVRYLMFSSFAGNYRDRNGGFKQLILRANHLFISTSEDHATRTWWNDMPSDSKYLNSMPVGFVSQIQEPGYKLRAVANPNLVFQWLLNPLKDFTFQALRHLERDCTYNQTRYLERLRVVAHENHVENRKAALHSTYGESGDGNANIHSVDLSDATNTFPLDIQLRVIRRLIESRTLLTPTERDLLNEGLDLFALMSRMPWEQRIDTSAPRQVKWTAGQPLGLGPSFATFALGHHALLSGLRTIYGGDYFILGDDLIIIGDKLHRMYLETLAKLRVNFSPEKSITSPTLAEFAGHVITPFTFYKKGRHFDFSRGANRTQSLSYMKDLGPFGVRYVTGTLMDRERVPPEIRKILWHSLMIYSSLPKEFGYGGSFQSDSWDPYKVMFDDHPMGHIQLEQELTPYLKYAQSMALSVALPEEFSSWQYKHLLNPGLFLNRREDSSRIATSRPTASKSNARKFYRRILLALGYENQTRLYNLYGSYLGVTTEEFNAWAVY
jgi:hypothetical protein